MLVLSINELHFYCAFCFFVSVINESSGHSADDVKRNIGTVLKRKKTAKQEGEKEKRKEKDRNQRQ